MAANIFSLVLASATGWALLALGYLPVAVLRNHSREPLKAVAAWVVVAATASPSIFHWYLIFAILCLVAFAKIEWPSGKFWLAASAALGLSLGLIFPIEVTPALFARETPYALASLYFGGACSGIAYALFITIRREPLGIWQHRGLAKILLPLSLAWIALLVARPYLSSHFAIVPPQPIHSDRIDQVFLIFVLGIAQLIVALFISLTRYPRSYFQPRILAATIAVVAFANNLLTQLFYA